MFRQFAQPRWDDWKLQRAAARLTGRKDAYVQLVAQLLLSLGMGRLRRFLPELRETVRAQVPFSVDEQSGYSEKGELLNYVECQRRFATLG